MQFPDRLHNVIGQESAKKAVNFLLAGMRQTSILPHMFLSAEMGGGKSFFSKQVAIAASDIHEEIHGERRKFANINAGQIASLEDFTAFMFDEVEDQPITVLIDEAHAIAPKITTRLLTMLEPSNDSKGFFAVGAGELEQKIEIDFRKATFILATTERNKIFQPLMDRLKQVNLNPLSNEELGSILLTQVNPKASVATDALVELVLRLRMNGRSAIKMGEHVNSYFAACNTLDFTLTDAENLFEILSIHPMGLSCEEVRVLKFLRANSTGAQLQGIANHFSQAPAVIREMERYLLRRGLMKIDGKRFISTLGRQYLDTYVKDSL